MKKLIILSGSSNSGKTKTLICLSKKFKIIYETSCYSPNDFKYICDKNGKRICICTAGDGAPITNDSINFFNQNKNCDVFISAARSSGATVNLLVDWANANKIDYIYVTKSWLADKNNRFSSFNNKFADFLNSLI